MNIIAFTFLIHKTTFQKFTTELVVFIQTFKVEKYRCNVTLEL